MSEPRNVYGFPFRAAGPLDGEPDYPPELEALTDLVAPVIHALARDDVRWVIDETLYQIARHIRRGGDLTLPQVGRLRAQGATVLYTPAREILPAGSDAP